ncbi:MAG: hypothetical protein VX453_07025, partial [Acidobacteriota bacterium]|nr:hypothetical protein [Acidobacteriota bacterium]
QLGHQWGDESRLAAIAGVPSTGLEQDRHTPPLFPGGTLVEAVLDATRTVERLDSGSAGLWFGWAGGRLSDCWRVVTVQVSSASALQNGCASTDVGA